LKTGKISVTGVVNIGSGRETSVAELIAHVERATGRRANVITHGEKSGGVPRLAADIGRARTLLSFRPKTSLADGLRLTLARDSRFAR